MGNASIAGCLDRVRTILAQARSRVWHATNDAMLSAYWEIGREIVDEEQRGEERARYGHALIRSLSNRLIREFGKGFSETSLRRMREFYLLYPAHLPPIRSTLLTESGAEAFRGLSWSHYLVLMRVRDRLARSFYEIECAKSGWSVRELERQIATLLFQRLSRSRDKAGVLALSREGQRVERPEDLIKDPYVLEFVGLPDAERWHETDLEQALVERLQSLVLELGSDLFLVARQKRLLIDGEHFWVDLVFYHRALRCFLLIDLKVGRIEQQDLGQMLGYLGHFEEHETREDESPPVGLVLGTDKNDTMVRYVVSHAGAQIFASRYQLHLPTEEELAQDVRRERERLRRRTPHHLR